MSLTAFQPIDWVPNFFIAGAPKAGTSSMHQWIADHPSAFGSQEKETYFFVDPGTHMHRPHAHISLGLAAWKHQFPIPAGERPRVIVESTPAYIYYHTALTEIPSLPSVPKCLFIVREPADQIFSLYTYFKNNWSWIPAHMSFGDFLDAVRHGGHDFGGNELARNALEYARYVEYLLSWREALGKDRMLVVTFDELKSNHVELVKKVAIWLGLDPGFYDSYEFPRENETYVPVNRALQRLNVAVRAKLPKGRLYEAMRSFYRRINTVKPEGAGDADTIALKALKAEFSDANVRLAVEFGLDLSGWSAQEE